MMVIYLQFKILVRQVSNCEKQQEVENRQRNSERRRKNAKKYIEKKEQLHG